VVALLDALVYVWEVGAEAGDGVQDGCPDGVSELCALLCFGCASSESYRYGPSKALIVSASRSSTACL
jgi:hypothetical protein